MWVDGVVRVVCGLSEETSCQDVVIALAQAIGEGLQLPAGMFRFVQLVKNDFNPMIFHLESVQQPEAEPLPPGRLRRVPCWFVWGFCWVGVDFLSTCLYALFKLFA